MTGASSDVRITACSPSSPAAKERSCSSSAGRRQRLLTMVEPSAQTQAGRWGSWPAPVKSRMEAMFTAMQAAARRRGEDAPEDYIGHGPNRITALPMEVPVCYQEVAHCMEKSIARIETAVLSALEHTPPELYADIVHNGIYLTGGGALLRGLDRRLTDKINIPFHIAEDPLHSVAKGTGIALKNVNNFSFLM